MDQYRTIKRMSILLTIVVVAMVYTASPVSAMWVPKWGHTVHAGKYYMKYSYSTGKVYVAKKKNGKFKATVVDDPRFATDGKYIYHLSYTSNGAACVKKYSIKSKADKKLKKIPSADSWKTVAVAGRYMWIEKDLRTLYRFDVKKKKLKFVKKNCSVNWLKDNYCIMETTNNKAFIYQATSKGKLKIVASLGTVNEISGDMYENSFVGIETKILYYTTSNGHKLYSIKADGKGRKHIKTFE